MEIRPCFSYGFAPMNQFAHSHPVDPGCLPRSRPGRLEPIRLVSDIRRRKTLVSGHFLGIFCPDSRGLGARLDRRPHHRAIVGKLRQMQLQTLLAPVLLVAALWLPGCASSKGPQALTIAPGTYEQAFDAAVEAARRQGLISVVKDRRSGVIETDPTVASTIFEPWRGGNASLHQAWDNTLNFQRRRARFEFVPVGFAPVPAQAAAADASTGPTAITPAPLSPDLTEFAGDLELRVNVVIERAYMPGIQLNDWTQYYPTRTIIIPPGDANDPAEPLPSIFWTGVARDAAFERRLLAAVQTALRESSAAAASAAVASPTASGVTPSLPGRGVRF